ncbi:MAG: NAD(P)/FAD-dependent oxidoreductase [Clostridiales bacterium]|nr:NAD(P)/FAD-dependent oxidoreductase [Clostridiales bacterium]
MSNDKVAIIGGGAAGLFASCRLIQCDIIPTLFEPNQLLGMKLGITGKGRCNVTNNCSVSEFMESIVSNPKFMYSSLNRFTPADTMAFFENLGVPLKTERGRRVFPVSDKATDIVLAMKNFIVSNGCRIISERVTSLSSSDNRVTEIKTNRKTYPGFDYVILCTGGLSYPKTGSTGDGYKLASSLGHTVTDLSPSLIPLECYEESCKEMMGLSLKNTGVKIIDKNSGKIVYNDFGEVLFTHFGLSGPTILSASTHMYPMEPKRYSVSLDLKPALDHETLDRRVLSDFGKYSNKVITNALSDLLPSKMIVPFVDFCKLPRDKKANSVTVAERESIVCGLKNFVFTVKGFRPISEAMVTRGGIRVNEINPNTLKSKKCDNLYFAGEIIDVDAYTGGFSLQIAFSTANAAAMAIKDEIDNKN